MRPALAASSSAAAWCRGLPVRHQGADCHVRLACAGRFLPRSQPASLVPAGHPRRGTSVCDAQDISTPAAPGGPMRNAAAMDADLEAAHFASAQRVVLDLELLGFDPTEVSPDARGRQLLSATFVAGLLWDASTQFIDGLVDDVADLRAVRDPLDLTQIVASSFVLSGLPERFHSSVTPLVAAKGLVVAVDLTARLSQGWRPPSCVAQELLLRCLLDAVEAATDRLGITEINPYWRSALEDALFEAPTTRGSTTGRPPGPRAPLTSPHVQPRRPWPSTCGSSRSIRHDVCRRMPRTSRHIRTTEARRALSRHSDVRCLGAGRRAPTVLWWSSLGIGNGSALCTAGVAGAARTQSFDRVIHPALPRQDSGAAGGKAAQERADAANA